MEKRSEQIDTTIVSARPEVWNKTELKARKFNNLLRSKSGLYNMAIGLNSAGEEVDVKLIGTYRQPKEGNRSTHRKVMQIKANNAFGLPEDTKPPFGE